MRVCLVRTGGVAGMRREASLDTKTLDPAKAGEIERLLQAAGLEKLPPADSRRREPDRFQYAITVNDGKQERTIRFGEQEATENVRLLVEAVWRESQAQPSGPQQA